MSASFPDQFSNRQLASEGKRWGSQGEQVSLQLIITQIVLPNPVGEEATLNPVGQLLLSRVDSIDSPEGDITFIGRTNFIGCAVPHIILGEERACSSHQVGRYQAFVRQNQDSITLLAKWKKTLPRGGLNIRANKLPTTDQRMFVHTDSLSEKKMEQLAKSMTRRETGSYVEMGAMSEQSMVCDPAFWPVQIDNATCHVTLALDWP